MKTRQKLTLLAIVILGMMLCTACSSGTSDEYPDLGGAGLDEIVEVTVPHGYSEAEGGGGSFLPTGECIGRSWGSEDGTGEIDAGILVYDGDPVMAGPATLEELIGDQDAEIMEYNGNRFYVVSGFSDENNIEDSALTAYVEYDKYILSFDITSDRALTKAQKDVFHDMLRSVRFAADRNGTEE